MARSINASEDKIESFNTKKSVLICGLGNIGCAYDIGSSDPGLVQTHAKAFSQLPGFDLIGGVDPSRENCFRFSRTYKVPTFAELSEALVTLKPQIVVVACPTDYHLGCIQLSAKHSCVEVILCEKPLAWNSEDGLKIVRLSEETGIKLFVNYMRRANPVNHDIGHKFLSNCKWIKGFGSYTKGLIHNGSHLLNLLEFWFGKPQSVVSLNQGRPAGKYDWERDFHIRFSKASFTIQYKHSEDYEDNSLQIHTHEGVLEYLYGGREITWRQFKDAQMRSRSGKHAGFETVVIPSFHTISQLHVARSLANELNGIPTSLCTGRQALETLDLALNILTERGGA